MSKAKSPGISLEPKPYKTKFSEIYVEPIGMYEKDRPKPKNK